MARYLVGPNKNTWGFQAALNAAVNGDIIEFQESYSLEVGTVDLKKSLIFEGNVKEKENGFRVYSNVLKGTFKISNGAKIEFHNLWLCVDKEKSNVINCVGRSGVEFTNSILENSQTEGDVYPVIFASQNSHLMLDNTTIWENPKIYLKVVVENSTVEINSSKFKNCRLSIEKCELKIKDSNFRATEGNTIWVVKSNVDMENTKIDGCAAEKRYPAIWVKDSRLTTRNCRINQPDYAYAINLTDNCFYQSENDESSSFYSENSRALMSNPVFLGVVEANENSTLYIRDQMKISNQLKEKIDLLVCNESVVYGNKLITCQKRNTNFRISSSSLVNLKELEYTEGSVEDLFFEVDETSKLSFPGYPPLLDWDTDSDPESEQECEDNVTNAKEQLDQLIGLKSVKKEIDKMLRMVEFNRQRVSKGLEPQEQSFHSVFLGNPGTGKTTVARLIGEVLFESGAFQSDEFKLIEASEPDFISQNVGGTAQQTLELLEQANGGVLFIDEAYTLNKKECNVDFGIEAINTILKYMEDHRGEIMIIFAGYTKEMEQFLKTNPGLTSRVPNKFVFEDYTQDEIVEIGERDLIAKQYRFEDPEYYSQQVKRAYRNTLDRSNGRWIRNFNEKLLKVLADRVIETGEEDLETIRNCDINNVLSQGKYQAGPDENEGALERLQKLIGISEVKEQVEQFISLAELNQKREEQGQINDDFTLHSLFLGNPGTGKTTVARIVGEILYEKGVIAARKFIEVSRSDLVAGYIGQTAIKTREVLESALGGVLFIDEAYSLSQGYSNDFGIEAIDEILKFMEDHRRDIVIIFSGYTEEMSEFLDMNSGLTSRIPHTFNFADYTPDEIVQIGLLGLHNAGYQVDEDYYRAVVTNNYSQTDDHSNGRWVRNLNEQIIMMMSRRVSDLEDADLNTILKEDLDQILLRAEEDESEMTGENVVEAEQRQVDSNGYVIPK